MIKFHATSSCINIISHNRQFVKCFFKKTPASGNFITDSFAGVKTNLFLVAQLS
tara:strand:+ start:968 stop:1129 length:162 start_codon:yes stop_codon:yes gene_type:complete